MTEDRMALVELLHGRPLSSRRPEAELAMTGVLPIGFASIRSREARPRRAVDMDSNASFDGEVERHMSRDDDYSLCGKLHQTRQVDLGQFPAPASPVGFIEPLS
jgi:hypothetical protein